MSGLYLKGVNAPPEIKASLFNLSKSIHFIKEDTKAANGHVFFGVNRVTDKGVAVKFYYWGGKTVYHAEPNQLASIKSDHVLRIQDAGLIDNMWAYFITPTCVNGDLDDQLETSSIGNYAAVDYVYQILSGLSHLHEKRFLHRDLKPANIYVDENHKAVIGDFGSVKKLPDGHLTIPASSHSILYRPPETITTNSYGITGDIYQAGIVLYQLLGGYLPYDANAYLSRSDMQRLKSLASPADESDFVDQCIKGLICSGKLLNYATMPPWVPESLKKIIKKSCHFDPEKRFQTASSFMAKLHAIRPSVLDWKVLDGHPVLSGALSYRVFDEGEYSRVQKSRDGRPWRNDNSFQEGSVNELVSLVSGAV